MQENTDWKAKYYSPEARAKIEERGKDWTPEKQAEATRAWTELMAEVEAALGEDRGAGSHANRDAPDRAEL